MCFSASASFVAAAVTGAAGLACLARVRRPAEIPLAATPLIFAIQQAIEGLIWLRLGHDPAAPTAGLALAFLVFAQVVWPIYAPLGVLLAEPEQRRRRLMTPLVAVGVALGMWLLAGLLAHEQRAVLMEHHVAYGWGGRPTLVVAGAYLSAVGIAPLMSSQRAVIALGLVVLAGSAVAITFYFNAFQSVWCFFAALASAVLVAHFHRPLPRIAAEATPTAPA
ncbi:MAG: DUF6629 family protein [Phenylobacterium sp.]|uniref:DUF6629 family protein n=1 Tax=Phenylobacterium sp. TaxID=1871053 RepID=UPI00391C2E71